MDKDMLELGICVREHGCFPKSYQLLKVLAANVLHLELNRSETEGTRTSLFVSGCYASLAMLLLISLHFSIDLKKLHQSFSDH